MHDISDLGRYLISYNPENKSSVLFEAALLELDVSYQQSGETRQDGARIKVLEPVHGDSLSLLNNIYYDSKLDPGDEIIIPARLLVSTVSAYKEKQLSSKEALRQKERQIKRKADALELKAKRLGIPVKRDKNEIELDCSLEELLDIIDN